MVSQVASADHQNSASGRWRLRAREHYEVHRYTKGDDSATYQGFSNTINAWYERPFAYSLGLAMGPVLGSARRSSGDLPLGERIQLYTVGIEGKYFPVADAKGFLRGGLNWHRLSTDSAVGDLNGSGVYVGAGWEFPLGCVSLAPEVAARLVDLQDGVRGSVITPSLGLHFYSGFDCR